METYQTDALHFYFLKLCKNGKHFLTVKYKGVSKSFQTK